MSLLEQSSSPLREGDLPVGVVLNPPDGDLSTSHLSQSQLFSIFFLGKDVKGLDLYYVLFLAWISWLVSREKTQEILVLKTNQKA